MVYGNKLGAHVSGTPEELGVPVTVADLGEFKIDYQYTETGNAERNLAFESFFHTDCDIGGPNFVTCLLYTSPSPRDATLSRMPSSA